MSETNRSADQHLLSLDSMVRLDAICVRFEKALQAGEAAEVAAYLKEAGTAAESAALAEQLIGLEAFYRERMAPAASPDDASDGIGGRFLLTVTAGPHQGRSFAFEEHDTFIVGRSRHAHFQLSAKDEFFSRLHFVIELNPPICRLVDLGSANGTFVNGKKVREADLKDGDVIGAGLTVIAVSVEETSADVGATTPFQPAVAEAVPAAPAAGADTIPDAEDLQSPRLGNYQLLRELGRGGMGKVYLALRLCDNSVVALKTILPAVRAGQSVIDRFFREAQILKNLQHENIVAFREMGQEEGFLYFAMDFVPGLDAARLQAEQGPLPVGRAVNLVCQLLDALAFAHESGFVHRDIKPANLMVTSANGQDLVKVVDFGLARAYQTSRLSGLTITGQIGGTQAFIAPEQITRFRDVKPSADQYATAATLYNLLTGHYTHDFGNSPKEWLAMVVQGKPTPIRTRRPEIPEDLARVIHRALAKRPAERFADVSALRTALAPYRS